MNENVRSVMPAERPFLFVFGDTRNSPIERLLVNVGGELGFNTAEFNPLGACGNPSLTSNSLDLEAIEIPDGSFVVLVTRGVNDTLLLKRLSNFNLSYIGVIASENRWAATSKELFKLGVRSEFLESVRAPAGIDINAYSLEEIAISVLAEIILVRRSLEREVSQYGTISDLGETGITTSLGEHQSQRENEFIVTIGTGVDYNSSPVAKFEED